MFDSKDRPLEDKEYPDEADLADDDTPYLDRCPACGAMVYEDAPQCPRCREWILGDGGQWRRSGKWYVRGGLYLTRTLLINWAFWLALAALAAVVALVEVLR